jgi:hypothetical protein
MSLALTEIMRLDPVRDHQRIALLVFTQEFPWDSQRALELALFRTFCAPSVSRILDAAGEFERRPQKRYDDTEIIISEIVEYGYDSERGRAALRRMNQIHARFAIDNRDYLYVLSTFLLEPMRWIDRFGYRRLVTGEREGLLHFWRAIGARMGIRDIPESLSDFESLNRDFEAEHFRYAKSNARIGQMTTKMLAGWFPAPLRPLVPLSVRALLDDRALEAFGFEPAPTALRAALEGVLHLRAGVLRHLLPARRRPKLRSRVTRRSYPRGYTLDEIGPPRDGPVRAVLNRET